MPNLGRVYLEWEVPLRAWEKGWHVDGEIWRQVKTPTHPDPLTSLYDPNWLCMGGLLALPWWIQAIGSQSSRDGWLAISFSAFRPGGLAFQTMMAAEDVGPSTSTGESVGCFGSKTAT